MRPSSGLNPFCRLSNQQLISLQQAVNFSLVPACEAAFSVPLPSPPYVYSKSQRRRIQQRAIHNCATAQHHGDNETRSLVALNVLSVCLPALCMISILLITFKLVYRSHLSRKFCNTILKTLKKARAEREVTDHPTLSINTVHHIDDAPVEQPLVVTSSRDLHQQGHLRKRIEGDPRIYKISLWDAAREGDFETLFRQTSDGANVNTLFSEGTPLIAAARYNRRNVLKLLLTKGAEVDFSSEPYDTALLAAIVHASHGCVADLLNHGANPNHSGPCQGSPLYAAAAQGREVIACLLIHHGARLSEAKGSAGSAIQVAALYGHLGCVQKLVEHGADIDSNVGGFLGMSPLHAAISQGRDQVVSYLLEQGALFGVQNPQDHTIPRLNVTERDTAVIEILTKHASKTLHSNINTAQLIAILDGRQDIKKVASLNSLREYWTALDQAQLARRQKILLKTKGLLLCNGESHKAGEDNRYPFDFSHQTSSPIEMTYY